MRKTWKCRRKFRTLPATRLAERAEFNFADALADFDLIRVAVNQEFAELDAPVAQGDEVAIFPPMTGG